jgi:hypothetical protein
MVLQYWSLILSTTGRKDETSSNWFPNQKLYCRVRPQAVSVFQPTNDDSEQRNKALQHTVLGDVFPRNLMGTHMLYTLLSVLLLLWIIGLVGHIGGSFIHLLLVVALAVFIFDVIAGRRAL